MTTTPASRPRSLSAAGLYRRAVDSLPLRVRHGAWYQYRNARYRRDFGRWPSVRDPQYFTEKVLWRIAHDRREILSVTCDKARMKEWARRTAPSFVRVPQSLWQGTDLRELAGVDLPEHWVLKPNHRSALVHFGTGAPDVDDLVARTAGWLDPLQWTALGEWAYTLADATYLVEDRIGVPGDDLTDYKFYVFEGEVALVHTDTDRFADRGHRLYSPDWRCVGGARRMSMGREVPRPQLLDEMLEAASAIGREFDFIRVDLYQHDGQVWFGEITPYPGSGTISWQPDELDLQLGRRWRLPSRDERPAPPVSRPVDRGGAVRGAPAAAGRVSR
ncbi:ATP-grasp fold amidoligase family protein [Kineococcus sp. SYSU DK006]|uniref:ATP-grasp fold amidoligase family protein n=1 Tax=Kineococcus sp. SYSU DK006 TaxID=3383127 RepID=UPI003D7D6E6A